MLPLYEHSFDEAKRRSELDIWLASRLENMACASEIAQLIKTGQSDLREQPGQALLQEFGIGRMISCLDGSLYTRADLLVQACEQTEEGVISL